MNTIYLRCFALMVVLSNSVTMAGSITPTDLPPFNPDDLLSATALNSRNDTLTGAINDNDSKLTKIVGSACTNPNDFMTGVDATGNPVCGTPPAAAGDITDVNTAPGSGLVGGSTAGTVNLGIDPNVVQKRLTTNCNAGNYMQGIDVNGVPACVAVPASAGDITEVNTAAGSGLTGGAVNGAVNLSVDPTVVQKRLANNCNADNYMQGIDVNGIPTCVPVPTSAGDITEVTTAAGSGLSGGNTTGAVALSVDTAVIQKRVSNTCVAPNFIRGIDVNGVADCQPENDTTYSAGAGVSIAPDLSINSNLGIQYVNDVPDQTLGATTVEFSSISVNAPTTGFIVASATGTRQCGTGALDFDLNLVLGTTSTPAKLFDANVGVFTEFNTSFVFPVQAGINAIGLQAKCTGAGGAGFLYVRSFYGIFIPTLLQ